MRSGRLTEAALLGPLILVMLGFVVVPAAVLGIFSLFDWVYAEPSGSMTLDNYAELLRNPLTWRVVVVTLQIAVPVTLLCVLGGYALAYRIAFGPPQEAKVLFLLVLTALMASYLVRIYAWRTLLGTNGVINGALIASGLTDAPMQLMLFSRNAVIIAEVSLFLPLAALSFFAALSGIDPSLREAARDLGAGRAQALWRVVLPITGPTLLATVALVFFLACGDYITPVYVGGPESVTVGRLIADAFGVSANYGRGAAQATLTATSFAIVFVLLRLVMRRTHLLPARAT